MVDRKEILDYMVALVNEFAKRHHLTDAQAFAYMWRYGAVDAIVDNYQAAHTLPFDDVCQTVSRVCRTKGGMLPVFKSSWNG